MPNPKIAVITPSIPPRKYMLNRALASVARQTLPAWETHVSIDMQRAGAAVNRQTALGMISPDCEWVAPLDDDDEMMPFHLEALYDYAKQTDADYVYSWFEVVGPNGISFGDHDPVFPPTHFSEPFDPADPVETTITVLIKYDLLNSVGGYQALHRPEAYAAGASTGEDRNLTLRCIEAGANIQHLVRRTWFWHHHGHNTSGRPDRW